MEALPHVPRPRPKDQETGTPNAAIASCACVYDEPPAPEHFWWGDAHHMQPFGENNRGVGHWIGMRMPGPHTGAPGLLGEATRVDFAPMIFRGTVLKGMATDFHD